MWPLTIKKFNWLSKKGISPVIATVILIALTMSIALMVLLWFRNLGGFLESKTTYDGINLELICEEVRMQVSYYEDSTSGTKEIYFSNIGNIPIYSLILKISNSKGHKTIDLREGLRDEISWSKEGFNSAEGFKEDIKSFIEENDQLLIIPVIKGTSEKGKDEVYVCNERHGYPIN